MTADALKKITTDALDQLRAALDQGHSEDLTALLKTMGRFHRYSVNNICLIAAQRPTATRVAGFHAWRALGRFVRKGEKGIAILAPITARRQEDTAGDDDSRTVVGFRAAYVFDIEQTDGATLPEPAQATGDPGTQTVCLTAAIGANGIVIEHVDDLGGALGTSSGGRIQVLNGLAPAAEFSVLVHEYGHELLHRSSDRPASRDTRELEAEAVAFVVSQAIGLDVVDSSRDYIHLYRGDGEALSQSLDRIQRTASSILGALGGGA
jgi:antirestriction protein ArdC